MQTNGKEQSSARIGVQNHHQQQQGQRWISKLTHVPIALFFSLSVSHRSRAGLSEGLGPPPLPSVVVVASYFLQHINLLLWIVTLSPLCE